MNDGGSHGRQATARRYLMCPPEHFAVTYAINPWMRPEMPVDAGRRHAPSGPGCGGSIIELGHDVRTIEPVPGLPDMVFAANGGTVVGGTVLGARFRYPQRAGEAGAYLRWFRDQRLSADPGRPGTSTRARATSCSPGARCWPATASAPTRPPRRSWPRCSGCRWSACGWSTRASTTWTPRCACSTRTPPCTTRPRSTRPRQAAIPTQFAELIEAKDEDADVLGLNAVSDGLHVVLPAQAREPGRAAARARLRAHRGGRVRAAQGRRRTQVLHAGTAGLREPS